MKPWLIFVILTVVCWGADVPMLHKGQLPSPDRAQDVARLFAPPRALELAGGLEPANLLITNQLLYQIELRQRNRALYQRNPAVPARRR